MTLGPPPLSTLGGTCLGRTTVLCPAHLRLHLVLRARTCSCLRLHSRLHLHLQGVRHRKQRPGGDTGTLKRPQGPRAKGREQGAFCNRTRGSSRRRPAIIYPPRLLPARDQTTTLLRPPGRTSRPSPLTVNCNTLACSSLAPPPNTPVRPHHCLRTIMAPRPEQSQLKRAAVRPRVPLLAYTHPARPPARPPPPERLHAHRVLARLPLLAWLHRVIVLTAPFGSITNSLVFLARVRPQSTSLTRPRNRAGPSACRNSSRSRRQSTPSSSCPRPSPTSPPRRAAPASRRAPPPRPRAAPARSSPRARRPTPRSRASRRRPRTPRPSPSRS